MTYARPPLLSPVLEEFVPPQFRGNVPDSLGSPWAKRLAYYPALDEDEEDAEQTASAGSLAKLYSTVLSKLTKWRKPATQRPGLVPCKKPVKIHKLDQKTSGTSRDRGRRRAPRKRRFITNPLCLFGKLRDSYVTMMNGVVTNVGGNLHGLASFGIGNFEPTNLDFSREYDTESLVQLAELEKSSSKPDTEYRNLQSRFGLCPDANPGIDIRIQKCTSMTDSKYRNEQFLRQSRTQSVR